MRFLFTVITCLMSTLLVTQAAVADQVDEKFRLMEQRIAEMEDRLHASEDKLSQRDALLTEHGLLADEQKDLGLRSAVGDFFEEVDVSGVAAASFNYRLVNSDVNGDLVGGNVGYFKNPNSNTFQVDQLWMILDKTPTEESRGGFHAELITGEAAQAQGATNDGTPYLYTGYASYLAPVGNGVQIDLGRLATPLGAEVVQTNGNYFVTQGAVFALQPVAHTGVSVTTELTDEIGFTGGVVNEVYSDTFTSTDNDKAYYGQLQFAGERFGLNVGGIWGNDSLAAGAGGSDANTSVVDVTLTADPSESLSLWANFDWVHTSGTDARTAGGTSVHGDAFGISGAGRFAITDTMGVATRVEYVQTEDSLANQTDDAELVTLTGTLDKTLAEGLVTRLELRWDTRLDEGGGFQQRTDAGGSTNNDQLVALWQMFYEF